MLQLWIMSANKDIYQCLYQQICKGMSRTIRGSSSRYELMVQDPPKSLWDTIREQTGATGRDLNDFLQGARGNYSVVTRDIDYELSLKEILPGEVVTLVFQKQNDSALGEIRMMKLASQDYLILGSKSSPWKLASIQILDAELVLRRTKSVCLPEIGDVKLSNIHMDIPSDYHRLLDMALFPRFRQTKVKNTIIPLYSQLGVLLSMTVSVDELNQFFQIAADYGVSTFSIRQMADCLSAATQIEG